MGIKDSVSKFIKAGRKRFSAMKYELARLNTSPLLGIPPVFGGQIYLAPQDTLLNTLGGNSLRALEIYYDLLTDSHAFACLDKILQEIVSRDMVVEPGDESEEAKAIAEWTEQMLKNLGTTNDEEHQGHQLANTFSSGFDSLTKALGLAYMIGRQPAEIMWAIDKDGKPYPKAVMPKDARRFEYHIDANGKIYPKLLTGANTDGMFLPPRKFIFHTFWAVPSDDPYGLGIARNIYYPVQWKREIFTYWLTTIDKYAQPISIGKAPASATDDEIAQFKEFLVNISAETAVALPDGFELSFESANPTSATEMFLQLIETLDKYISLAILGEAVTGEQVGSGLGSQQEVISNSIRIMKAKAVSDGINATLNNTLIKWAVQYRWGANAPLPKVKRDFERKTDIAAWLQNANLIKQLGYDVSPEQIEKITGIELVKKKSKPLSSMDDVLAQQQAMLSKK